jgi:hypothetical protein
VNRRRLALFLGLFFLLPLPILVFDGLVPVARIVLLAVVCILVGFFEGASGPVMSITFLMVAQAAVYTLILGAVAWLADRALRPIPPRMVRTVLLVALAAALFASIAFDVYTTPFGRTAQSNLFGALS